MAIVENAYDKTAQIVAVKPQDFEAREKELLVLAKKLMPRLPFDLVNVLVIDRMGKDISGVGVDPNVVGRKFNDHKAVEGELPKVRKNLPPRPYPGLARQRHGHGHGRILQVGILARPIRPPRALTALSPATSRPPCRHWILKPTTKCSHAALGTIGLVEPSNAKLIWIADTLHLDEVECSAAYLDEAQRRDDLEIINKPQDIPFDAAGNLPDLRNRINHENTERRNSK